MCRQKHLPRSPHLCRTLVAAYEKVVDTEPGTAQAHYNLGKLHLKMGNKALALEEYEILKTLDEELADELRGLINNQLG